MFVVLVASIGFAVVGLVCLLKFGFQSNGSSLGKERQGLGEVSASSPKPSPQVGKRYEPIVEELYGAPKVAAAPIAVGDKWATLVVKIRAEDKPFLPKGELVIDALQAPIAVSKMEKVEVEKATQLEPSVKMDKSTKKAEEFWGKFRVAD
jgi:hypothetical protein